MGVRCKRFKAEMKNYILLQTAAKSFLSNLYLKQGIGSVYHGWFHLQRLPRAFRNARRARITKWKILAHCGIRTRDLPLTTRRRYLWATRTVACRVDTGSPGFNCAFFFKLPAADGRCSKIIFREIHFVNSLKSANFLIGQTAKQNNYNMTKNTRLFCYIYHVLQVNFLK